MSRGKRRLRSMALAAFVLLAIVAFLIGRQQDRLSAQRAVNEPTGVPGSTSRSHHEAIAEEPFSPSLQARENAASARQSPLPAKDVPIIDWFDQAAEQARRGDSHAACRLGSELVRCRRNLERAERMRAMAETMMAMPSLALPTSR